MWELVGLFLVSSLGLFSIFLFVFFFSKFQCVSFVLSCYMLLPLRSLFAFSERQKGGRSRREEMWNEEELDRVERGETIITIYHVEKKISFQEKETIRKKNIPKNKMIKLN